MDPFFNGMIDEKYKDGVCFANPVFVFILLKS